MSDTDAGGTGPEHAGRTAAPQGEAVTGDAAGGAAAPGGAGLATAADGDAEEEADAPMARRVRRGVLAVLAVLVVYYAAPVRRVDSTAGIVLTVVGLLAGIAILVWLVSRQVQRLLRSDPGDKSVRLEGLVLIVYVVVPVFALGYFALEEADPGQFAELETKTDALYFTLSTLATVGFGDVHATDQLSRALVTIQMVFDLVIVAAVASLLSTRIRARAAQRRADEHAARD